MRAYILSIGSELMHGHLTDTNATWLAQELVPLGIELLHVVHVGDDRARLTRSISTALAEADLVICTGGVGPTEDDMTREAISDAIGETPEVDEALLETVRAYFAQRGLDMPERNKKQAWLIPSAESMDNPVGTAPGWFVRTDGKAIIAMPGVPREMFRMWKEQAIPRLLERLPIRFVREITHKCIGIGESAAEQQVIDIIMKGSPIIGTYAKDDGIHIRITGVADTAEEAERLMQEGSAAIRAELGAYIYADEPQSLPSALLAILRERNWNIAVADAAGGGRFGALLSATPDAAETLILTTSMPAQGPSAEMMAEIAVEAGADVGVGIALDHMPVGNRLYEGTITVAIAGQVTAFETFPLKVAYEEFQRRSGVIAADVLRRTLLGITPS